MRSRSRWTGTAASRSHDQGRGIPVDIEPRTGLSGVEVVFTKLHAGGKFGAGSYNATGGLHGVGSSVVNALSTRLDVEVDRNGATWGMSFRRGTPGSFDGDGPTARFTPGSGLRKLGRTKKGVTGTRVRYWPDRQIFLRDAQLSLDDLLRPSPADQLPGARAGAAGRRPAHRGGHHRALPARRRDRGVLRVPGPRRGRHRGDPAAGPGPVHRDRADARRRRPHDPDRRRARPRHRHRGALGNRLRHDHALVRQHHRHPQGRHPRGRLRACSDQGVRLGAGGHPAAQGRGGGRQGRRAGGDDRGRHRSAGRAAVRGPDQGGAGHAGGVRSGGQGGRTAS